MIRTLRTPKDYDDLNISTRLLIEHALQKSYALTYCPASMQGETGIVICRKKPLEIRFKSDATSLSPIYGYFAAEDKVLTANLLEEAHVMTPVGYECSTYEEIENVIDFSKKRYVVKPTSMNHGDGIRTNLANATMVKEAIVYALSVSDAKTVLVQEQVEGDEYRFLVLNNEVIAVAARSPAFVVGDGASTVRHLVEVRNTENGRGEGHLAPRTMISCGDIANNFGLSLLERVPEVDEKVQVTQTSNLSKGGDATDHTDTAHASLKKMAISAARACSLGLAGVDIMTDSITNPTHSYVIEVNLAPGLRMHHYPTNGLARDVAGMIFSALEQKAKEDLTTIPVSAFVDFCSYKNMKQIPARIDTGARTSALWASNIRHKGDSVSFTFFGKGSPFYTGKRVVLPITGKRLVTSSMGHEQERIVVTLPILLDGKKMKAKFTLANRSKQTYPILIGRNTLRGVFAVDSSDPGSAVLYKDPTEENEYRETELSS
jgi:D-alanine-D-alanine ligase-like ATP-grasp enzyme